MNAKTQNQYLRFVAPYLYYLDVRYDNCVVFAGARRKVDGESQLMLVPVWAACPTVFQGTGSIGANCTSEVAAFYATPPGSD